MSKMFVLWTRNCTWIVTTKMTIYYLFHLLSWYCWQLRYLQRPKMWLRWPWVQVTLGKSHPIVLFEHITPIFWSQVIIVLGHNIIWYHCKRFQKFSGLFGAQPLHMLSRVERMIYVLSNYEVIVIFGFNSWVPTTTTCCSFRKYLLVILIPLSELTRLPIVYCL